MSLVPITGIGDTAAKLRLNFDTAIILVIFLFYKSHVAGVSLEVFRTNEIVSVVPPFLTV